MDDIRFAFGRNWASLLEHLDESRIDAACRSLRELLGSGSLEGLRFADVGSGSGLFSLAARRLGAKVVSFDYDPESVACGLELRRRCLPDDPDWTIEQGSILDPVYIASLGRFDIVYSWGVLHHTGDLWSALDQAGRLVAPGGKLAIAIYNYQRVMTPIWTRIKRTYVASPAPVRALMRGGAVAGFGLRRLLGGLGRQSRPADGGIRRGMRFYQDVVDWIGGWPFQAARPEEVFRFCRDRGFRLRELTTVGGRLGCNEFLFERTAG